MAWRFTKSQTGYLDEYLGFGLLWELLTHMFSPKVLDRAFVLEFPTMPPSQKPDESLALPAPMLQKGV